jgi:hypothetical protein
MHNGGEKPTLSDWITFLSGESNAGVPNLINAGVFVLAAWVALYATGHSNTISFSVVIGGVLLIWVFQQLVNVIGRRTRKAQELLDSIMSGKGKTLAQLEWEWKTYLTSKKPWRWPWRLRWHLRWPVYWDS